MLKDSLFVIVTCLAFQVYAEGSTQKSGCCNNPTKWKIYNETAKELFIGCINHAEGLSEPIRFAFKSKAPVEIYIWDRWHNDGLGLNAGRWECATSQAEDPLNQPGINKTFVTTDWGENTALDVKKHLDNQYRVVKRIESVTPSELRSTKK